VDELDVGAVRAVFDATEPFTVGVEEEVLLVDPMTMLPAPVAADVVAAAADARIKTELPACQIEIMTRPHVDVASAIAELRAGREALVATCGEAVRPVAAAVHPLAVGTEPVSATARGQELLAEFREIATRQLVGALQVHVALGDADTTLAVYNALRGYLPELAALAAASPFHEGRDTGLASVRPLIADQLPRQGVPPVIPSWERYVDDLRWGATSTHVREPRRWWWELRPHVVQGTLEIRVPDVQPTVAASGAIASVIHALVRHLADLHHRGVRLPCPPTWRIAENRWAALRDGVHGRLADLDDGTPRPTSARLHQLLDTVEGHSGDGLDPARALIRANAADDLRAVGVDGAVAWLADAFCG
jgi:carboxylate-amine ligase